MDKNALHFNLLSRLFRDAGFMPVNRADDPMWMCQDARESLPKLARLIAEECAKICDEMEGAPDCAYARRIRGVFEA